MEELQMNLVFRSRGTDYGGYVHVFSRDGTFERSITCNDCTWFGGAVATHGNLIVTKANQNSLKKIFIYTIQGVLLKSLEQDGSYIQVAISEKFVVSTTRDDKTYIYYNSEPDFPKKAEINQVGYNVALSGERIVIGDPSVNNNDGVAYLYNTDGALVTTLDRQDASSGSKFGTSATITGDKVLVGQMLMMIKDNILDQSLSTLLIQESSSKKLWHQMVKQTIILVVACVPLELKVMIIILEQLTCSTVLLKKNVLVLCYVVVVLIIYI